MMEMKKTFITVIQIALVILIASVGAIFFSQQRYTQLCVRSEKSSIQSMCVLCDADQFSTLSYACTRQYMVPANTTEDQAHCLLTTCLRQVPGQHGTVIGRKKRTPASPQSLIQRHETVMMDEDDDIE
ncbi:uncharacterized protein LOC141848782 isoform X1 [Brevipalpus obovatus]|uniref:uncharacterized protein LOC141848782 isoform X1 n=1 Tax=Brevipalpus obovatus TaxID=246614 RepID=UPI003D9DD967